MDINFNQEWEFIQSEIHREKPNRANMVKREILFSLQLLLSNIQNEILNDNLDELTEEYLRLKFCLLVF